MRAAFGAFRLGVVYRFVYRFEVITAIVAAIVVVVVNASLWGAVAEQAGTVGGLSRGELSTYVVCAWVVAQITASNVDQYVGMRFRTGNIAADLARPMDLQLFATARELGRAAASVPLTLVPVVLAASALFPVLLPDRWATWPLTAVSLALAVLVGAELAFLVGLATFRTQNVVGLGYLKTTVVALLSGAVVPLDAMPEAARTAVMALPFQAMAHAPVSAFLERSGPWDLAVQVAWVLLLLALCRVAWSRMTSHITVQGG